MRKDRSRTVDFWDWFRYGTGGKPGYVRLFFDKWWLLHLVLGATIAFLISKNLPDAAATILVPLAGVFIGLAFAWAGNAQALLQTDEMVLVARHKRGGLRDYVFTFQAAVFALLVTLTAWGLAGLGVFDTLLLGKHHPDAYRLVSVILFALSSFSIRECWHVVLGAQIMILLRADLQDDAAVVREASEVKMSRTGS